MDRNLRLYSAYQVCRSMLFWMPVFFLYMLSIVRLEEVLLLEAIYYLGVVLLEVPSGYFSDAAGRKRTLMISSACWGSASVVFALAPDFTWLMVAQLLLAAGMAFNSGTDTALLFESLQITNRAEEMAPREGRALAWSFGGGAFSALVGGLLAGFDLRLAYYLSAVAGLAGLGVALFFREPPRHRAHPPIRQIRTCAGKLADPTLLWVFVFVVGMTVLNHVPWEFFQPWIRFWVGDGSDYALTPAVAGGIIAATMTISVGASAFASRIRDRFGVAGTLLATMLLQGVVIVGMMWIHPIIVGLLLLRAVPRAVMTPVINAAVHPRVQDEIRATFLSMQSLAGRLAFSGSLFVAAWAVGGTESITPEIMNRLLFAFAIGAGGLLLLLAAASPWVARR